MRKRSINILALFFLTLFLALSTHAGANPYKLAYKIEWGRMMLAKSELYVFASSHQMTVQAQIESEGFASLVSKFRSEARADLVNVDQLWQSKRLWMRRQSGNESVESWVEWGDSGDVKTQQRNPELDLAKVHPLASRFSRPVIDPYAAIMRVLEQVTSVTECSGSMDIFDGRRHARINITTRGQVMLERDRKNGFEGPSLLCELELVPLGGHRMNSRTNKRRMISVFLARVTSGQWLPVRIEVEGWIGRIIARLDTSTH